MGTKATVIEGIKPCCYQIKDENRAKKSLEEAGSLILIEGNGFGSGNARYVL